MTAPTRYEIRETQVNGRRTTRYTLWEINDDTGAANIICHSNSRHIVEVQAIELMERQARKEAHMEYEPYYTVNDGLETSGWYVLSSIDNTKIGPLISHDTALMAAKTPE